MAIALPLDARYDQERTDAVGFIGASSMERLPVETAIAETVRQLKSIPVRWRQLPASRAKSLARHCPPPPSGRRMPGGSV